MRGSLYEAALALEINAQVVLLRRNKGVLFDRMENVEKFNLGGQSVAVVDYWQVIGPVPAVHCEYKAQI